MTWFAGRARRGDTCQESAQRNSLSPAVDLDFILMEIYSEKDWGVFFSFGVRKGVFCMCSFLSSSCGKLRPKSVWNKCWKADWFWFARGRRGKAYFLVTARNRKCEDLGASKQQYLSSRLKDFSLSVLSNILNMSERLLQEPFKLKFQFCEFNPYKR